MKSYIDEKITWRDIRSEESGWEDITELEKRPQDAICETRGVVIFEDDDYIRVAMTTCNHPDDHPQAGSVTDIPKGVIIKREKLIPMLRGKM